MTTTDSPLQLAALVQRLRTDYPDVAHEDVQVCVHSAWQAVRFFNADDDAEMTELAGRIAERDLRLRLGLEREAARLDPEKHSR